MYVFCHFIVILSHDIVFFFFFKQKTAYEMRISDWSSDVCSSDLPNTLVQLETGSRTEPNLKATEIELYDGLQARSVNAWPSARFDLLSIFRYFKVVMPSGFYRSEEHTSELQSLMRISYAVLRLKKTTQ